MTIYNINLGIGWASSGVEYAQAYRGRVFKQLGLDAKFIFTDFFAQDNLVDLTRNIGFEDREIIWLYSYFTDQQLAPVTYTLDQVRQQFQGIIDREERNGKLVRLYCQAQDIFLTAYLTEEGGECVHRVEYVSKGNLIRKDYFLSSKLFTEYYYPQDNRAVLYLRRFFNQNGTRAYEELVGEKGSCFRMPDAFLSSKEELMGYFMRRLSLTEKDVLLLDRATGIGQAVFRYKGKAKLGVVIHAEHYSLNGVTDQHILWNNFYDYQFTNAKDVSFYVTSTEKQKEVLGEQFRRYMHCNPVIYAIPVGSLEQLRRPIQARKNYSIITASRLAVEKHIDWLIRAVIVAKQRFPELHFDIYGSGGEEGKLQAIIQEHGAADYICLKGHHDLKEIYQDYQLYLTASKSEGFGLTLLEAVGSGLPLIGFDVPYGNQTFVRHGENGYLLDNPAIEDERVIVTAFVEALERFFSEGVIEQMQESSYQLAAEFLSEKVEEKWLQLIKEMVGND